MTPPHIPTGAQEKIKCEVEWFNSMRSIVFNLANTNRMSTHHLSSSEALRQNSRCTQTKPMIHFCSLTITAVTCPLQSQNFCVQREISNSLLILSLVYRAFKTVLTFLPNTHLSFYNNSSLLHFLEMCYIWRRK